LYYVWIRTYGPGSYRWALSEKDISSFFNIIAESPFVSVPINDLPPNYDWDNGVILTYGCATTTTTTTTTTEPYIYSSSIQLFDFIP